MMPSVAPTKSRKTFRSPLKNLTNRRFFGMKKAGVDSKRLEKEKEKVLKKLEKTITEQKDLEENQESFVSPRHPNSPASLNYRTPKITPEALQTPPLPTPSPFSGPQWCDFGVSIAEEDMRDFSPIECSPSPYSMRDASEVWNESSADILADLLLSSPNAEEWVPEESTLVEPTIKQPTSIMVTGNNVQSTIETKNDPQNEPWFLVAIHHLFFGLFVLVFGLLWTVLSSAIWIVLALSVWIVSRL